MRTEARALRVLALVLPALVVAGCGPPDAPATITQWPLDHPSHPPRATSTAGMVVTGSSYATEAGVYMLELGGNAVDAAVAAALALTVAEPTQSGLGGRTQILIRMADGTVHGIDGTTQVPAGYDPGTAPAGEHGHAAVGVPGTLAALQRALDEHGSLPMSDALVPAIRYARRGILMPSGVAGRIAGLAPELQPQSTLARKLLDSEGRPPQARRLWYQPDLARTLEWIGAGGGVDLFYRGAIADSIAADMARNGGFVTAEDLAGYEAVDSEIGRGSFRGFELIGSYLPASGVTVIEILQIVDRLALPDDEAGRAAALAEALLVGFEDREIAEALEAPAAVAWLTSDSLADRRAAEIGARLAVTEATAAPVGVPEAAEAPFTTHLSVADTFGNVVALTQSLGPTGGARVVTPGLGFLYASTLGGYLSGGGPGYRPWSSQAPLIVLDEGVPLLVMGGAGARRILSALVTTLVRVLDERMALDVAMDAPRLHPAGGDVLVEMGWDGAAALAGRGYRVEERERTYFARLNGVHLLGDLMVGVAEPRWIESAAAGPSRSLTRSR